MNTNIMLNPAALGDEINAINALKESALTVITETQKAIVELTGPSGGLSSPEGGKLATTYTEKANKMLNDLDSFVQEYTTALNNAAQNLINASATNFSNIG